MLNRFHMMAALTAAALCLDGCSDVFIDAVVRSGNGDTETDTENDPQSVATDQNGRQIDALDRGVVAVVHPELGVYVGWRLLAWDPPDIAFNVYRDNQRINDAPIRDTTDFVDPNGAEGDFYFIRPVLDGKESERSEPVLVMSNPYREISISGELPVYRAGVGDLDGDGEYDYVLVRPKALTEAFIGVSPDTFKIEGYLRHGLLRWQIDLGRNIELRDTHGPMVVYDLDGDGISEIIQKTADGTIDGVGNPKGDIDADYRNDLGLVFSGPEFLSVFSGIDGRELAHTDWIPRDSFEPWNNTNHEWVNHNFIGIAYLDGKRPSIIVVRGIAEHQEVWAFDYEGQSLQRRWTWSSLNEVDGYRYQAYHSLRVGDVDGDGRDEIVLGSCALDDNGQTLWVEYEGHCDRSILTDIDPSPAQPGLELWHCQGYAPNYQQPLTLRDAATGTRIFGPGESMIKDMRALAADIDPTGPGMEIWGAKSDLYDSNGGYISGNPGTCNFAVYWDGDPLRELLDDDVPGSIELFKWNYEQQTLTPLKTFEGELVGVADLFGDWREEIIVSTAGGIQVHTTIEPAKQRLVTLMHDAVYRLSVATETMGHMQTTQTGFFIGDGMTD